MNLTQGKKMLFEQGLNLFSALGSAGLPKAFHVAMQQAHIDMDRYPTLILIGHGGNAMWRQARAQDRLQGADPIDSFSLFYVTRFINEYMDGCPHVVLYPGPIPIPLQQLGALAGWHHASPLGVGVNEQYGLWFGYRAAVLVQTKLAVDVAVRGDSPCVRCKDKPCVHTCPASALSTTNSPNVGVCVDFRLEHNSPCANQCLARSVCPAGEQYRYSDDQMRYFYRRSLASIRQYRKAAVGSGVSA